MANDTIKGFQTTSGQKQYDYYSLANRPEVAELDENGKVLSSQLPSYVDDVIEAASKNSFPTTGEAGKIYVAIDTNLSYRWSGSAYVEISPSLALGENATTAHRGDHGKAAYDHSQIKEGNPHGTTKAHLGLDKVENKSSADIIKEIKYPVTSVNGKTGDIQLKASDVGAAELGTDGKIPMSQLPSMEEIQGEALKNKADTIQVKIGKTVDISNRAATPIKSIKIFGKSTQDHNPTSANEPVDVVNFETGGKVSLELTAKGTYGDYNQNAQVKIPNLMRGVPAWDNANYIDSNGQKWICDEVDFIKGVKVERVGQAEIPIDSLYWDNGYDAAALDIIYDSKINPNGKILCNRAYIDGINGNGHENGAYGGMFGVYNTLYFKSDWFGCSNLEEFKSYFYRNPTYLVYALANPKEIPLTQEELKECAYIYNDENGYGLTNDITEDMEVRYYTETSALPVVHSIQDNGKILTINEKGWVEAKEPTDELLGFENKANVAPTKLGTSITVTDCAQAPIKGLKLYGKTTIEGTSPAKLINVGESGSVKVDIKNGTAIHKINEDKELELSMEAIGYFNYDRYFEKSCFANATYELDYRINLNGCTDCHPNVFVVRGLNTNGVAASILNIRTFIYGDKIYLGAMDGDGDHNAGVLCEEGKTYRVKVELDLIKNTYELYVDGQKAIAKGRKYRTPAIAFTGIRLTVSREGDWTAPKVYWDNILVTSSGRTVFEEYFANIDSTKWKYNSSYFSLDNGAVKGTLASGDTTNTSCASLQNFYGGTGIGVRPTVIEFDWKVTGNDPSSTFESNILLKGTSTAVNIGVKGGWLNAQYGSTSCIFESNKFNRVKIVDNRPASNTIDLYLNGVLVAENKSFVNNQTYWKSLEFVVKNNNGSASESAWFDNLVVYQNGNYLYTLLDERFNHTSELNNWILSNVISTTGSITVPTKYYSTNITITGKDGLAGFQTDYKATYVDEKGYPWICDEVDFASGERIERIAKVVIDKKYLGDDPGYYLVLTSYDNIFAIYCRGFSGFDDKCQTAYSDTYHFSGLCTSLQEFAESAEDKTFGLVPNPSGSGAYGGTIYFKDTSFSSANEVYTSIVDNPMTFMFVYEDPKISKLSDELLEKIAILHTNQYVTEVVNNGNVPMELQYYTPSTAVQMFNSPSDAGKILTIDEHGCVVPGKNNNIGFGLGQTQGKVITSNKELDNTLENGWYYADFNYLTINGWIDLASAPIFVWNGRQFLYFDSHGDRTFAYRYKTYSKTWSDWIWLNPPEAMFWIDYQSPVGYNGLIIPIAEQYNYKQVYTTTYSFGEIPSSGIRTMSFGQFKPTQIIRCSGYLNSGGCLPFYGEDQTEAVVSATTSGITIKTNNMQSGLKACVQIWFTWD